MSSDLEVDPEFGIVMDPCEHPSADGVYTDPETGYAAEWCCLACGAVWRDVPDLDGPCWSSRLGPFRKDYIVLAKEADRE